ncbi:hypothetical protein CDAR_264071 [Caerostris darwini]|uniref:Uncharacterized protein n=1 Tax=Caerostris darwini TaxID=1538125 RepID=A0AAV4T8V2_9ARAC|nr:hypothetical protein CDAR_264071 [Caerostris darwini]
MKSCSHQGQRGACECRKRLPWRRAISSQDWRRGMRSQEGCFAVGRMRRLGAAASTAAADERDTCGGGRKRAASDPAGKSGVFPESCEGVLPFFIISPRKKVTQGRAQCRSTFPETDLEHLRKVPCEQIWTRPFFFCEKKDANFCESKQPRPHEWTRRLKLIISIILPCLMGGTTVRGKRSSLDLVLEKEEIQIFESNIIVFISDVSVMIMEKHLFNRGREEREKYRNHKMLWISIPNIEYQRWRVGCKESGVEPI